MRVCVQHAKARAPGGVSARCAASRLFGGRGDNSSADPRELGCAARVGVSGRTRVIKPTRLARGNEHPIAGGCPGHSFAVRRGHVSAAGRAWHRFCSAAGPITGRAGVGAGSPSKG